MQLQTIIWQLSNHKASFVSKQLQINVFSLVNIAQKKELDQIGQVL
jgi:hypothetical protein